MIRALAALERGSLVATPQPSDGITYAAKIEKSETRIDFVKAAQSVHDHIRGLSPAPGAWFEAAGPGGKLERIKVLRSTLMPGEGAPGVLLDDHLTVACGTGAVRLLEVQRAGKKPASAEEFRRGFPLAAGQRLLAPG
jgi:methionyl-tRNA formyltransferase